MKNECGLATTTYPEQLPLPPQQQRWRTLVVDDSFGYRTVLCAVLKQEGIVDMIGTAGNGVQAIERVAAMQPDLVIMDVQMPEMDGLTAASVLSRDFPRTRIVLMSAEDSPQLRLASRAAGANAFLPKSRIAWDIAEVLQVMQTESGSRREDNAPAP